MAGLIQPGTDVAYVLKGDITTFSPYNRALVYTGTEKEVTIAEEDDTRGFAGLLMTVQISKSAQQGYNVTAYDGDNLTANKAGIRTAIGAGAIAPGQPVGLGPDGKLKAIEDFYTTPSATKIVAQVGVAESRCYADGEAFNVRLLGK